MPAKSDRRREMTRGKFWCDPCMTWRTGATLLYFDDADLDRIAAGSVDARPMLPTMRWADGGRVESMGGDQ